MLIKPVLRRTNRFYGNFQLIKSIVTVANGRTSNARLLNLGNNSDSVEKSSFLLLSRCYKHKINVRTFLSDKERVRDFVGLLSEDEKRMLVEELKSGNYDLNDDNLTNEINQQQDSEQDGTFGTSTVEPTGQQLRQIAIHQSLPFVGFGFLDNLIMIIAGDYIDLTLGVTFGISTMAAAGLGNALSDVAGVGSAYYVERISDKVGVKNPKLSFAQLQMSKTRWAVQLGRAIGVAVGCIIGMFPLLFLPHKEDRAREGDSHSTNLTTNPINLVTPALD